MEVISSCSNLLGSTHLAWLKADTFLVHEAFLVVIYYHNTIYMNRNNFFDVILPSTSDQGKSLQVSRCVYTV